MGNFNPKSVLDSSYLAPPDEVAHVFVAAGGSGPKAGAKIQRMSDYLTGNFSQLWLTDARQPDPKQRVAVHEQIKAGEVLIK